ncbi:MAG: P1 family peptidase [Chloroflexi bacterium]|nr:P1 family peptidase [Chloroflexota bacterium]
MNGTLTDVPGLLAGHYTDADNGTGCTVVLTPPGTTGGVDVRGAAPGTRETDLLRSENTVAGVNGVVLSGGSAYGLGSADGVMRFLEERGVGHPVGNHIVPIVPAAIIFDLGVGNGMVRPTATEGYAAAEAATDAPVTQGSVGAGTGATVGKALGRERAMKGGVGSASLDLGDGVVLAALAVVNAVGGVHDPDTGALLAGSRGADGAPVESTALYASHDYGRTPAQGPTALGNTTIGVVATNVRLTKTQANRLATLAHDGLALAIRPAHTVHDGDTMFALATSEIDAPEEFPRLCALTPSVVASAVVSAIEHATDLHGYPAYGSTRTYRSMSHG